MAHLSPNFTTATLAKLDRRTRESRLLEATRAELVAHVGGQPSATQRALIDRCSMLSLHLALLDEKTLSAGGTMTEHDSRQYLAWSNSFTRAMRDLGVKPAAAKAPSLADLISRPAPARAPVAVAVE